MLAQGFNLVLQAESGPCLNEIPTKYHDQIQFISSVDACYSQSRILIGTSSHDASLETAHMQPGSVFIDIELQFDTNFSTREPRDDLMIIGGNCISVSDDVKLGSQSFGRFMTQPLTGAMAEVMLLALENQPGRFSETSSLDSNSILDIGEIAERHGFFALPLSHQGSPIDKLDVIKLQCHDYRDSKIDRDSDKNDEKAGQAERPTLDFVEHMIQDQPSKEKTLARHRRYINPVMVDFLGNQNCDNVFIQSEGVYLTDHAGRQFLDMVCGYGCLSLGHNPQPVINAVTEYLSQQGPNFVQYISIAERPAKLAEVLCHIAPGHLERVFFSNSGTEAVEAAIKLAKAATGNPTIAYLKNSYHGKTMGSLSVTGREKHRTHFQPLLSHTIEVPFGDLDALATTLKDNDVGAFILEPIQGEGGVQIPPEGYLKGVQDLCRETNTLLMVDEIQTGFSRTGRLFACNWEDVEPDVLILSKALSGGVMPIGATLCSREVWDRAYGTLDRFLHHTSTFGGATWPRLPVLPQSVKFWHKHFHSGLTNWERISNKPCRTLPRIIHSFPKSEGKDSCLVSSLIITMVLLNPNPIARFSQVLNDNMHLLPEDVRQQLQTAVQPMDFSIAEILCLCFVTKMCVDHQILTFFTANSYTVVRVQPPLVITKTDLDRFVNAFQTVCDDLSTIFNQEQEGPL
ncbi:aminotransferase class III-fold pyridoxal phosphate-dependent enzyme [Vibrio sp. PP-XX7]